MSKSKKFIECVEIHANTIDYGKSHVDYIDIIATLTDGQTMQLTPRGTVRFVSGIGGGHYEEEINDNDKMTNKEIWEKIKKALLAGKAVTLPM